MKHKKLSNNVGQTRSGVQTPVPPEPNLPEIVLGQIKWFGGVNAKTGRVNNFGFISRAGADVYFHGSQSEANPAGLVSGARVAFRLAKGIDGKHQALSVRVLHQLADGELVSLLSTSEVLSAEDVLAVALVRSVLAPCEHQVLQAVVALSKLESTRHALRRFWEKFPPDTPNSSFFPLAPLDVKVATCRMRFAQFKRDLGNLFESVQCAKTHVDAEDIYLGLDEWDNKLAESWASSDSEAVLAKMLSARAAEKAAICFYELAESHVEDISISQLHGHSREWMTHDLLVDSLVPVDVKNARRPVNGENFYVEHTVPRFKLDRQDRTVKVAGVLSPYLRLRYIREPGAAGFRIGKIIYLGETSLTRIRELTSDFGSSNLEISRNDERSYPPWLFSYPRKWYRALSQDIRRLTENIE